MGFVFPDCNLYTDAEKDMLLFSLDYTFYFVYSLYIMIKKSKMKNRNAMLAIIFTVCFGMHALKAQSIYFSFTNGTHTSYALSTVRSITFTGDVMHLNKTDGTTDSWNVNAIGNYNYTGFDSGVQEAGSKAISELSVYPNPTKGPINLQYQVQQAGEVKIEITDITGKLIKTLPQKQQAIGNYTVTWNGADANGNFINSGIYFCKITIGNTSISKKIIITNQ